MIIGYKVVCNENSVQQCDLKDEVILCHLWGFLVVGLCFSDESDHFELALHGLFKVNYDFMAVNP